MDHFPGSKDLLHAVRDRTRLSVTGHNSMSDDFYCVENQSFLLWYIH